MTDTPLRRVLFLCTGNSARSILAECILNRDGAGRFQAFSAGSHPKGEVNPGALRWLKANGFGVEGLRSKSWEEFDAEGAPALDLVITVCDAAAGEVCPIWPGRPTRGHWSLEDPAAVEGSEAEVDRAFANTARLLSRRIASLIDLPFDRLDGPTLGLRIDDIGRDQDEISHP